jgi:hypothetical protein
MGGQGEHVGDKRAECAKKKKSTWFEKFQNTNAQQMAGYHCA